MDESKKAVRDFICAIAVGFAVYIPLVCVGFAAAGKFRVGVLSGAVYGSAVMLLYYYLFARAIKRAASDEPEAAKKRIQASYSMRMFLLVILIGAGVLFSTDFAPAKLFEWLPIIISMIIPRISMAVWQTVNKKKDNSKESDERDGN